MWDLLPSSDAIRLLWVWFLRPVLVFGGTVYVALALLLTWFQRSLIYLPRHETSISVNGPRLREHQVHDVSVRTPDGLTLHGWHVTPPGREFADREELDSRLRGDQPVILFFPGNAGHRGYRTEDFFLLTQTRADLFAFDYRGYGDNEGRPTETGLGEDAATIWKYLTVVRGIAPGRIVIYGESLGGASAVRLAREACDAGTPPRGLILVAAFDSLTAASGWHYPWLPVGLLLLDRYPSDQRIGGVTCPILHIHGALDTVVPYALGERLFTRAPADSASGQPKQFVTLKRANHNDILETSEREYQTAITQFLNTVAEHAATD